MFNTIKTYKDFSELKVGDVVYVFNIAGRFPKIGARVTVEKDCFRSLLAIFDALPNTDSNFICFSLDVGDTPFADGIDVVSSLLVWGEPPFIWVIAKDITEVFVPNDVLLETGFYKRCLKPVLEQAPREDSRTAQEGEVG